MGSHLGDSSGSGGPTHIYGLGIIAFLLFGGFMTISFNLRDIAAEIDGMNKGEIFAPSKEEQKCQDGQ